MKIQISFREPGKGFYKMIISKDEIIRFTRGKARREPIQKGSIFNSIPIKYITSIRIIDSTQICNICKTNKTKLICYECIINTLKTGVTTSNLNELPIKVK